ncbi:MAG: putative rap/ran-GAP family protein, partial [Streblomastix strix]
MKVGVLFYDRGQTHETEMFSNKDGSAEFNQFLNFIGTRIHLQGFDGYSGDLDHVSTLLNYMANNKQQIDRKRYIGNDNVVIVFQQPGAEPYKCDTIISESNHAIINVRPIKKQEALMMIKNRTEQLRSFVLSKNRKRKKNNLQVNKKLIMIEIEGQEDVFMRRRPRGSGGDEPQVEGGFSDQPETDILVTYRSTTQQQPSSSSSSEHSPSPVPIFDEDLTYRSYDNVRADIDIDESANYSD